VDEPEHGCAEPLAIQGESMLAQLSPARPAPAGAVAPSDLVPLFDAARRGAPLEPAMRTLVRGLGFDSFRYGRFPDDQPRRDSRLLFWATEPPEWHDVYARNAYIEIDPRITRTRGRAAPMLWDAARLPAEPRLQCFARDAARFGIRSGVAVSFSDAWHARVVVALNSPVSPVDASREQRIGRRLGQVMLLATQFHDLFMADATVADATALRGAPLSAREIQCLRMAAHGLTSADIGVKLGISERTVNFHFHNTIAKLDVLNRNEAIAQAIARALIRVDA
jgi:DNA-binding CsgD family transcriptional regulator